MLPVIWNAETEFPPAFAGMSFDSSFKDDITVPCGASPQPFGTVVASVAATGLSVLPIGTNPIEGVALHDHRFSGGIVGQEGYVQFNAMSVRRRGRIWALASGTCTKDAVAKYDPATGIFADAGTGTLPNAKFITGHIAVPGINGVGSQTVVGVELGSPVV